MKIVRFFILACVFLISSELYAQDYKTAVGVRGGFPTGLNAKHFIKSNVALEGIISGYRGGSELTALYEIHANAFDVPYLNWYYGGGGHIGFFSDTVLRPNYYFSNRGTGVAFGLDGVIGIEYTLTDIPFVFGVDMKPVFDFVPDPRVWFGAGFSVRFYF